MADLLRELVAHTGISPATLVAIIGTAPNSYKVYNIPKRNGGSRTIAQPSRQLKIIQRALIEVVLKSLPVHKAATAYNSGSTIAENARRHAGHIPILKYDFREFFPSITSKDWENYCLKYNVFDSQQDIKISSLVLFRRAKGERTLRLSIGAPSSPILSNILMFDFDALLSEAIREDALTYPKNANEIRYSRYADDMTFSADRTGYLNSVPQILRKIINEIEFPRLELNHDKTVRITTKHRRTVTGMILANDGRVTIGWNLKKLVRSKVHHFSKGGMDQDALDKLTGQLAFINAVEPEYLDILRKKYGADLIKKITKNRPKTKYRSH